MIGGSIGARLTAWYVGVLTVATLALAGASWWLSGQSIIRAADISLRARVEGVRDFLENPRTRLSVEALRDEFGEYAELTRGEALLEVIDGSGVVLSRPAIPGWEDMVDSEATAATSSADVRPDRPHARPFAVPRRVRAYRRTWTHLPCDRRRAHGAGLRGAQPISPLVAPARARGDRTRGCRWVLGQSASSQARRSSHAGSSGHHRSKPRPKARAACRGRRAPSSRLDLQ